MSNVMMCFVRVQSSDEHTILHGLHSAVHTYLSHSPTRIEGAHPQTCQQFVARKNYNKIAIFIWNGLV